MSQSLQVDSVLELNSDEELVFICRMFAKCASQKKCCKSFVKTIPASALSCKRTVYSTVEHLSDKFSAGQKENTYCVPTEKKLDNTGTQMETSPKKSLCQVTVHGDVSKSSAHMAREL
jgi:hypothetical protein